ncbi:MAG: SPOR domain-containing protein [Holophagaceae bacterium]
MAFRDPQPLALSRQAVLLVTAVGVGLIALSYVLGVQVGKGSASLRRPDAKSVDEQLKELPEPLLDQLKLFQPGDGPPDARGLDTPKPAEAKVEPKGEPKPGIEAKPDAKPEPKPEARASANAPAKSEPKPEAKPEPKAESAERWTLQLVATPDPAEATRVATKAKAAGFPAKVVKDGKAWKVRLAKAAPREAADATGEKLKAAGFKPFAVRAE